MNNKTIEKAVRATIEAGNTNGQFFEGIREEVQAELEAQIDKRRDDGKKHDDAYIDSNPIMEDINIHFSLSYAPDDAKAEKAAKKKTGVRCTKCKWVHEADSVKGTSFMGVELCLEHSAAAANTAENLKEEAAHYKTALEGALAGAADVRRRLDLALTLANKAGAALTLVKLLADYLEESHGEEIKHKHYGDKPLPDGAPCSYCRVIAKAREMLKGAK